MTKVLIRKEVTTMQTVGSDKRPSIASLWGAARHGRGATPGSKVSIPGRLAAVAGLGAKAAAAGAAGLQTAHALQGGNYAAPLQAGVMYQGLDPTGAVMGQATQGTPQEETAPVAVSLPAVHGRRPSGPAPVAPVLNAQFPNMTNVGGNNLSPLPIQRPMPPIPTAPANPVVQQSYQAPPYLSPTAQPAQQPAQQPVAQPQPVVQTIPNTTATATATGADAVQTAFQGAQGINNVPVKYDEHTGEEIPQGADAVQTAFQGAQRNPYDPVLASFSDEVINRLGPDRIFKMTPHQLGTLSAYMYLKLR